MSERPDDEALYPPQNSIEREECPICHEEPSDMGLNHLFSCPNKLDVSYGDGTVARQYVAVDALLARISNLGGFDTSAKAPRGAFYVKRDDVRSIISELGGRINA